MFGLRDGSANRRVDETIAKTAAFFEAMGVPASLSSYALGGDPIAAVVANLKASRRVRLGERLDMTLDDAAKILELALSSPT